MQLSVSAGRKVSNEKSVGVNENSVSRMDKLVRVNKGSYQASIYDLRMLTNYSFTVQANFFDGSTSSPTLSLSPNPVIYYPKHEPANNRPSLFTFNDYDNFGNSIIAETKGCKYI